MSSVYSLTLAFLLLQIHTLKITKLCSGVKIILMNETRQYHKLVFDADYFRR